MSETTLYLYIFSGPHLGAKIALSEGKNIIGSDDTADIVFFNQSSSKDFNIAPRHASINVLIEREELKVASEENPNEELVEIPEEILQELPDTALDDIPSEEAKADEILGKVLSIKVSVSSIDGQIYNELGGEAQDSFVIENGEAFYIASTCLVWNFADQVQEAIIPKLSVNASLANLDEQDRQDEQNQEENNQLDINGNLVAQNRENDENEVAKLAAQEAEKAERKSFIKKATISSALALGLLALSIAYEPQNDNITFEINYLTAALAEEKIENIELFQQIINGKESILIEGYVHNESERQKIQSMARRLQYPVYISVEVQNDLLRAVQDSFALYGIFPSLYVKDSKLHVDAYIQDPLLEEAAFATLNKDIAELPTVQRNVIHENNLSQLIDEKLTLDGIHNATTEFGKGAISILGVFTPTDKVNIHKSMNEIIDKLNIPLHYSLSHSVASQSLANAQNTAFDVSTTSGQSVTTVVEDVEQSSDGSSFISVNPRTINFGDQIDSINFSNEYGSYDSSQENQTTDTTNTSNSSVTTNRETNSRAFGNSSNTLSIAKRPIQSNTRKSNTIVPIKPITISGLKINSIHNGNIPFLTTSEGQRLFVGAFLPNGFTLESIESSQISIRKGTQRVTISLDR